MANSAWESSDGCNDEELLVLGLLGNNSQSATTNPKMISPTGA